MSEAATPLEQDPTPVGLLDEVRASRQAQMAEQVNELKLVIEWCAAHEVPADEAATVVEFGRDTGLALAGEGAPCVSEFAVVELAAALGMTTEAGKSHVGKVLEVRYRLPGFWEEVVAGRLPFWRAARVAEHTHVLPMAGARFVDTRLAKTASKVTYAQVERLCEEALMRFDPEAAEEKRQQALERRRVDVHTEDVGPDGVVDVTGALDLADALDLDNALNTEAATLKALGNTESHDVRRSQALGRIARRQTQLDLNPDHPDGRADRGDHTDTRDHTDASGHTDPGQHPGSGGSDGFDAEAAARSGLVKPRQVVVHVHTHDQDCARCATTRSPITVDQVASWCADPDTQVVIREVVDTTGHIHVDGYETGARLGDQTVERDVVCAFPFCTRPAESCDCDHVVPHSRGGPTCSCNIAPGCRGHHRAKTHGGWSYVVLSPGHYLWRSPNGLWFSKDHSGTRDLGHLQPT